MDRTGRVPRAQSRPQSVATGRQRLSESYEDRLGFVRQLTPRYPHHDDTLGCKNRIATPISFEIRSRHVVRKAVNLDDEPFFTPEEINLGPADLTVGIRHGKLCATDHPEEVLLRFRPCQGRRCGVLKQGPKSPYAWMVTTPRQV